MGQSKALALNLVPVDHRLAQILHVHGRSTRCCGGPRRTGNRWRSRWSHRHGHNARFFLYVIEHNRLLQKGIGDDAAQGRVDAGFAVTRTPQSRRRLGWRSASGGLRFAGALGTRWRRRRRYGWRLTHSGHILTRPQTVYPGSQSVVHKVRNPVDGGIGIP